MPLPDLPVATVAAAAPPVGPMCEFAVDETSVRLGLPGLGAVSVSADGIRVLAPTDEAAEQTWARLGTWATAQGLIAQGLCVLRGAAIAREGRAYAVIGATRSGTSLTAAQMTRHGWGLVSDGLVAITSDGTLLGGRPTARLDEAAAERLFADCVQRPVATERPRRDVDLPGAPDAPLAGYVAIGVRESREGLAMSDAPEERPPAALQICGHVPGTVSAAPPAAPSVVIERGMPRSMDDLAVIGPPPLAARLDALLAQRP